MKPQIDKELCIGCGLCVSVAPKNFRLDENYKSQVTDESIDEEKLREAKEACPVEAISLEEMSNNQ